MNKKQKLFLVAGVALVCGLIIRSTFSKAAGTADSTITSAAPAASPSQTNPAASPNPQAPPQSPSAGTTTATAQTNAAPVEAREAGDGKTVLPPDGKETVGKETIGKEVLPPVGESIGTRPQEVIQGVPFPPPEYLGKNALLSPPSPISVSGPTVSPDTR